MSNELDVLGSARLRNRRGFLGWMGRAGIVAIGGLAGLTASQQPAAAHAYHRACCHLARRPGGCNGSGKNFTCPQGTKRAWTCCTGGAIYGCGECQAGGTSCWTGDAYYCSEYWFVYSTGYTCR